MQITSQEHYDVIAQFEKGNWGYRLDKEPKDQWAKGHIYQHGELNQLFLAFRKGYALAKCVYQTNAA